MSTEVRPLQTEDSDNEPLSVFTEDRSGQIKKNKDCEFVLTSRPLFSKIYEKKKLWRKTDIIHEKIEAEQTQPLQVDDYTNNAIVQVKSEPEEVSSATEKEGNLDNNGGFTNMFISYILPPLQCDSPPTDIWLDSKSINQTGPISCVLCYECFLNKNKLLLHYVLNHNKPFCGTCRYFVSDKDSWEKHWECHLPLRCSHCPVKFMDESSLRSHFVSYHNLAHCRMCNLMLPVGESYTKHLYMKHCVIINQDKDIEEVWVVRNRKTWIFSCLLCGKDNLPSVDFLKHFLYHHKFALKSLTNLVNGKDLKFCVLGANISTFTQLAEPDSNELSTDYVQTNNDSTTDNSEDVKQDNPLCLKIKKEIVSDDESVDLNENVEDTPNNEKPDPEPITDTGSEMSLATQSFLVKCSGREDFDATLVEFINVAKNELDYVSKTLSSETMVDDCWIHYDGECNDPISIACPLCVAIITFTSPLNLSNHITKQHCLKHNATYVCRFCLAACNSYQELIKHFELENGCFENLFLCQFCNKEFSTRESVRTHLKQHKNELKNNECTSAHLGLKCRFCPRLFWDEISREKHHCEDHYKLNKEQFYKCCMCDKIFSDKIWWAHHDLNEHSNLSNKKSALTWIAFRCLICYDVHPQIDDVRQHFQEKHPDCKRFYCSVPGCISNPFRIPRYLKRHYEVNHKPGVHSHTNNESNLRCDDCGKQMSTIRAANTHRTVAHGDKSTSRFKCRICGLGLPTMQDRKLHYLVVHPDIPAFTCTVCGKGYNNKSALYSHRTQSHSVSLVTFTCSYCNKVFSKRDSYKEHLLIHIGPRHVCPHCSRVFVQRSNMLRHVRLHTGEKPYPCIHCDKTFSDKGACNSHMRTHSRQDAYPCTYCGQKFLQKQKLKYHLRKHTGEDLETCPVCDKKFTNNTNLREHLKTHDDSCPVNCPHCGKIFTSKRYMDRHIRDTHSNTAEVHPCPICARPCPRLIALRNHLLTHATVKHISCLLCGKSYNGKKSINRHLNKRHGIQPTDDNYRSSYYQLDPRHCGLGLDEETIGRVFGPEKEMKPIVPVPIPIVENKTNNKKVTGNDSSDSSDDDYKPSSTVRKKLKKVTKKDDKSNSDGDVPVSGLELASLKSRARRETSRAVNYVLDSDDEMPKTFKKKSKVKCRKKIKVKDVLPIEYTADEDNGEYAYVDIKQEPIDYD